MKKFLTVLLMAAMLLSAAVCHAQGSGAEADQGVSGENGEMPVSSEISQENRTLIVYFSLGNNAAYPEGIDASTSASLVLDGENLLGTTEYLAYLIRKNVGGDVHGIQTIEPYPADFDAVVDQNHDEMDEGALPRLVESRLNMAQYDTVFIGYPIWATNAPRAIFAFLAEYDLSGKTIIPFCTHDGYGAGSSYADIAEAVPQAKEVLEGLAVEAPDVPEAESVVADWLQDIGVSRQDERGERVEGTPITVAIGDAVLNGVLYDTALAGEIRAYFPLTVSMTGFGGREYYGGVDFYPENLEGGQRNFENGEITYCEAHHNMAIFYAQTDDPELSVDVIPIGKVTSDLSLFEELPDSVEITFALAGE